MYISRYLYFTKSLEPSYNLLKRHIVLNNYTSLNFYFSNRFYSQKKLKKMCDVPPEIEECHFKACQQGLEHYTDQVTGYLVFTELYHLNRGICCGNGW